MLHEQAELVADRAFKRGQEVERARIVELLDAECECEHDHHCAYHRAIVLIEKASK